MSMFVIIGRDVAQAVTDCLQKLNMAENPVWITELGQGPGMLEDAARVPADLLILDVDTGPGLGPAVLRYRLARPLTRIVLLAPGKLPGDIEVAGVVQAGVYDVVTDINELENILDRPQAELANAALWLDPSLAPDFSRRTQIQERVVERRVAVSQRPVLIAVTGVASGVGSTTVACTLASYLSRRGYRTVLAESGEQSSLGVITEKNLDQQPVQWLPNLDVCIEPMPRNLVRTRQHSYVVADLGDCPCEQLAQIDADLAVVVLPQAHRIMRAITWLREGRQQADLNSLRYVAIGEKKTTEKVVGIWREVCSELIPRMKSTPASIYLLPVNGEGQDWPPGYRRGSEKLEQACIKLLADVLPDAGHEKSERIWFPFRRKKPRMESYQ